MNFLNNFLYEDKVIVISKNKVIERKNGICEKIVALFLYGWVIFTTVYYLNDGFLAVKIKNKREMNSVCMNKDLEREIVAINSILSNINSYLSGINYYDRFVNLKNSGYDIEHIDKEFLSFQEKKDDKMYAKFVSLIRNTNNDLNGLDELVSSRINGLNSVISRSEVMREKIDNLYMASYSSNVEENIDGSEIIENKSNLLKDLSHLNDKINYLGFLERTLMKMPIVKPLNQYFLTSKFGFRRDPFTKEKKMHRGIDMVGITGSKVKATADGMVERSGAGAKIGNVVVIDHGDNVKTYYGHLKDNLVQVGDKIKRGDVVGTQGNTGRSTGPHLHYQIDVDGQSINPNDFIEIGEKFF